MRNSVREENIRQITEKLEEAFAEKEDWLAVLGEAVYQYQKKTVRKNDSQRPQETRRPGGAPDPSSGGRGGTLSPESTAPPCLPGDRPRSAMW